MVLELLDIAGWLAVLGGVVEMLRGLVLHSRMDAEHRTAGRPFGTLTPEGKKHFFFGVVLLVGGHVLKDIIPAMINAAGSM